MMGHWLGWEFGWGGWIMFAGMLVFWGLVIWLIVSLVRRSGSRSCMSDHQTSDSAMEILKSRYAKGEIGKEEFEEKKKALM
jgi:putative membrane protein